MPKFPNQDDDMNDFAEILNKNDKVSNERLNRNEEDDDNEYPRINSKKTNTNNDDPHRDYPRNQSKNSNNNNNYLKDSHSNENVIANRGGYEKKYNRKDQDRDNEDDYYQKDREREHNKNKYSFDKKANDYRSYDPDEEKYNNKPAHIINYDYEKYKAETENNYSPNRSQSKAFEKTDLVKDSYQNPFMIPAEAKKNPLTITTSSQVFFQAKEKEIIETNDNLSPMNSKLDFNKTGNNESADYIKKTTVGNTYNYNTTHNRMNNNSNINDDRKKNLDTSVPRHMNIEDSNLNNTNIRKKYKGK